MTQEIFDLFMEFETKLKQTLEQEENKSKANELLYSFWALMHSFYEDNTLKALALMQYQEIDFTDNKLEEANKDE